MPPLPFLSLNPTDKVSVTQTHIFFLKGPFSQWHPSTFTGSFVLGGEEYEFNCAEQYMMAAKARLFGDMETFEEIMAVQQGRHPHEAPKAQKELGRKVKNFDPTEWNANARQIVFQGNWFKFNQNSDMGLYLDDTADKTLVEGAHYDPVWGVGLAWDDPLIADPANWRGTNWLGETLMAVRMWRSEIANTVHMYTEFNPFRISVSTIDAENARLTAENTRLKEAINKALIEISGGLCYFKAEAKHAQLQDADRTLKNAMAAVGQENSALEELAREITATADNISPTARTYPADVMLEWASRLRAVSGAK